VSINKVVTDVQTFFKRCTNCGVCYRYQEHDSGVHNFNDILLISIDLCHFLRDCLHEHMPIGSVVKVLERKLNRQLNSQAIINAYLHYESMCEHPYDYSCNLCGYHPTTLIMDLNKKVAFDCPLSDLELPDDYDANEADTVNCDTFWRNVELGMILRGFPQRKVPAFNIKPSLLGWSPFISRNSRSGPVIVNTEHKESEQTEWGIRKGLSRNHRGRLVELLQHSPRHEIESFAKTLGAKTTGAKIDIISRIKLAISKDNHKFRKAFSKLWGSSGGWVSGTCTHGVIYCLKFVLRAESPRDYIDLILS
jgi:hypothetical protein